MPVPFQTSRRVEFRDTDAAGIMHFTAILGMMEEAEHEFLRHIGLPLFRPAPGGKVSWPRVSVSAEFAAPARFEDILQIEVSVQRIGKRSVTYGFALRQGEQRIANGAMSSVCCLVTKHQIEAIDIPADVVDMLSAYALPTTSKENQ